MVICRMHKRYRMSENKESRGFLTSSDLNTVAWKTTLQNQRAV